MTILTQQECAVIVEILTKVQEEDNEHGNDNLERLKKPFIFDTKWMNVGGVAIFRNDFQ